MVRSRKAAGRTPRPAGDPDDPFGEPSNWTARVRQLVNALNLSTVLGFVIALVGRAHCVPGPRHTLLATSLRLPLRAGAMTIGDVVLTRKTVEEIRSRPRLLRHELRHAVQYAWCLGPLMWIPYGLAGGWSWVLTGEPATRNVFERRAGLDDGSYRERPLRPAWRRLRSGRSA